MSIKKQIKVKDEIIYKRTHEAAFTLVPTSILINQTLARLKFSRENKSKPTFSLRESYKFR